MTRPAQITRVLPLALLLLCAGVLLKGLVTSTHGEEDEAQAPRRIEVLFLGSKNLFNQILCLF